ncbi:unnamed protein product [Lymnaea stagnalis]|uniref:Transmembrane protein 267 n=1 Tax=Lymnaea stagnalis TaxID=6523 RepID=A0AAV2I9Q2_LYMST
MLLTSDIGGYSHLVRALVDSLTHALVGALVWAFVENSALLNDWKKWLNCFFCAVLAASVDSDHFLAAGSLNLENALHLERRPPFHNTSIIPVIVLLCWIFRHYKPYLNYFPLMFLTSWLSHHLRDANHRGLWLAPFGHTSTLPFYLYVFLIVLLAFFTRLWYCHLTLTKNINLTKVLDII